MHLQTSPPASEAEQRSCQRWAPATRAARQICRTEVSPGSNSWLRKLLRCRSLAQHLREAMLLDCPLLLYCLFYCLPWPSLLGMALYTATIQGKGGGRIQGREAKWLWGSIKRKVARVKNYNQGTRGGHQTPPKSIHHFSKASKEPEDTAQQRDKQWEWKRPPEFLSYFLLLVVLTTSLAKARRRACNLGPQTRARLIKSWWEQNNQNLMTRVMKNPRLDGPLSCNNRIKSPMHNFQFIVQFLIL